MVFERGFRFPERCFDGGPVQLVPDHYFSRRYEACFFQDLQIKPSSEVIVHGLPFYSCVQRHFFDGHDCCFRGSFPIGDFFAFVEFQEEGVHACCAVFFAGHKSEAREEDFAEFVDVVAEGFCVFEEEFHGVHLFCLQKRLADGSACLFCKFSAVVSV